LIDGTHGCRLTIPVISVVLDDAEGIDPEIALSKASRKQYGVLERFRKKFEGQSSGYVFVEGFVRQHSRHV